MLQTESAEAPIRPARLRKAEDIELTAWTLFAERGFANVTMDQIASSAGCSIRTVTRLFPTKEDLLLTFMREKNALILAELDAVDPQEPGILLNLWRCWARLTKQHEVGLERFALFRKASLGAPEVTDRAVGEQHRMTRALLLHKLRSSPEFSQATRTETIVLAHLLDGLHVATVAAWQEKRHEQDLRALIGNAEDVLGTLAAAAAAVGQPR
jgi:AcrR family transcriptional regulator